MGERCLVGWILNGGSTRLRWNNSLELSLHLLLTKGCIDMKRLMFGISSAPEWYQHTIQQALAGCEGAYNIHEDIIVHGRTVEEHDSRLRKTLECICEKGLFLNREKCVFGMSQLTFMGYLLSSKGIVPKESRVEAVVRAKEPENAEEVRSFLGLVNFNAKFIPNPEPLRELIRKNVTFVWGSEQQAAFDTLKSSLGNAENLAYFDRNAEEKKLVTDPCRTWSGANPGPARTRACGRIRKPKFDRCRA